MLSRRFILPDTNLFFECQRLESLPWSELGGDPLEVLLAKPVLDQIDKHKKGGGRTRKRALETFNRVRTMLAASIDVEVIQDAGPRVLLKLAGDLAVSDKHGATLDLNKTDDRLAAIVSALIDAGNDAILLTHDTGPASTARALGLPFFLIPDHWLRPAEASPEEKEIAELQGRVANYAFQEPRLKLHLASHPGPKAIARRFISKFEPLDEDDIETAISRLEAAHPRKTDFTTPPRKPRTLKFGSKVIGDDVRFEPPTDEEQRAYLDDSYPVWLDTCRERLSMLHEAIKKKTPALALRFELENDGSRPANNLRIEFDAGGDIRLHRPDHTDDDDVADTDEGGPLTELDSCGLEKLPVPPTPPPWKRIVESREPSQQVDVSAHDALARLSEQIEGPTAGIRKMLEHDDRMRRLSLGMGVSDLTHGIIQPIRSEIPDFPRPYIPPPHDPEAFYYDQWSPGVPVEYGALTCDRLRHRSGVEAFEFDVLFRDRAEADATILCIVHADNVTEPVQLRVRVEQVVEAVKPVVQMEALLVEAGVPPLGPEPAPDDDQSSSADHDPEDASN